MLYSLKTTINPLLMENSTTPHYAFIDESGTAACQS